VNCTSFVREYVEKLKSTWEVTEKSTDLDSVGYVRVSQHLNEYSNSLKTKLISPDIINLEQLS
jgi:hypothetical protein